MNSIGFVLMIPSLKRKYLLIKLPDIPTRGEVNDIFNTLEKGATGLVLAAESAIGKNPINSINYLKKIINSYLKYKKNYK